MDWFCTTVNNRLGSFKLCSFDRTLFCYLLSAVIQSVMSESDQDVQTEN